MKILDENLDTSINNVTIYLTLSEAKEFIDSLKDLIKKPLNNHAHISDDDYQKEITLCIYDKDNREGFNQRSEDLINDDI